MADYTLKIRRFDPESGEPAYWADYDVDLPPGALGARRHPPGEGPRGRLDRHPLLLPRRDLRLLRRAHQRPLRTRLQHPHRRGQRARARRRDHRRADGQHARGQGPGHGHGGRALEEGPPRGAVARARRGAARGPGVHRARGGDARRDPGDGLHPLRRVRLGVPLARGGPGVHRPRGPRQGVPLRRRPARRRARGAPQGPRRGPARHLRLHPLLRLRGGVPQGRGAHEPDHAPAPHGHRRLRHQGLEQRLRAREGVHEHPREMGHPARGATAAALVRRRLTREGPDAPERDQAVAWRPCRR